MTRPHEQYLMEALPKVMQPAGEGFAHPYLTPTPRDGVYGGMMWDWDSLLCGYGYLLTAPEKACASIQGVVLNVLEHLGPSGNSAMALVTSVDKFGVPQEDPPVGTIRPVVGQMARIVCDQLQKAGQPAFDWLRPYWPALKRVVSFYHRYRRHEDLYYWSTAWESLADNNPALWDYPGYGVQACDMAGFVYQDFLAMAQLAPHMDDDEAAYDFALWARQLKDACLAKLWHDEKQSFFNRLMDDRSSIERVVYTNFGPLWVGMLDIEDADQRAKAQAMIERYMLDPEHLWCNFGIRTTSTQDSDYNVEPIHTPSNWQGPVWFIANYLSACALRRYGYAEQAQEVCDRTLKMLDQNVEKYGHVTENFHPETGENLVADRFVSWTSIALRFEQDLKANQDLFDTTI